MPDRCQHREAAGSLERGAFAKKRGVTPSIDSAPLMHAILRLTLQPSIDIVARLVLGESVALLDFAFELLALSVDLGDIVVGSLPHFSLI